jgi:hypothetical protein
MLLAVALGAVIQLSHPDVQIHTYRDVPVLVSAPPLNTVPLPRPKPHRVIRHKPPVPPLFYHPELHRDPFDQNWSG